MTNTDIKLSPKNCFDYAIYNFGYYLLNMWIMTFLNIYLTDVVGVTLSTVASMIIVIRIIDAINDPIIGNIADKSNSPKGKYVPWLRWGGIAMAIFTFLLFSANPDWSSSFKTGWVFCTYLLVTVAATCADMPYLALNGVMTSDVRERAKLSCWSQIFLNIGGQVVGIVAMPLVLLIAGTTSGSAASTGYSVSVGICSLIFVLICLYTPGRVREVVKPAKSQAKLPISAQIKAFCRNPNAVIVSFLFFANGICNYGRSAILAYYAQYVCNDMSVVSVFSAIVLISTFAGSIFSTILHKATKDKRLSCIICYTVCAVSSAPLFFLRPTNVTYWILTFFSVTTIIAGSTLSFSMFGDVSDYGEYRFHIRSDGFVSAISSMLMKAGSALGPAVILLVLKNVGFIANASVQNATVNHVLNFGVSFLVTIATGACAVLMLFYNLSDKRIAEVRKDLVPSKQF